jgi:hypothetical protein
MVREAGVELRLHSWFSHALIRDGRIEGVITETKVGREAIIGEAVIDATGDLDVAANAGASFIHGGYMVTTVFRLGGVDTDEAERFQFDEPGRFRTIDRDARRIIAGSWDYWWLKTPLPGIVWCNCPHMTGLDGLKVEDLTAAEFEGRRRIHALVDYVRANLPGFARCYVVDVAPQTGIRQTRLLDGEYVVTKDDVTGRVHFPDSIARGRDYYTPYRAMLPKGVDGCWSPGGTTRRRRRHRRFRARSRRAWQWVKLPVPRRRWRWPPVRGSGTSTWLRCSKNCGRRAPIPATSPRPRPACWRGTE